MREHFAHDIRQCLARQFGERHPAHPGGRRRLGGHLGRIDRKLQRKMREDVPHHARARAAISAWPAPGAAPRRARPRFRNRATTRWSAPRSCRRAGPWRDACARARSRRRAARRRPRRAAAALPASAPCAETVSGSPRRRAAHELVQGQSAQAGFFGVQMVAPRSIMAWAKSPARRSGISDWAKPRMVSAWRPAIAPRPQTAAPPPARHCRRPPRPGASNAIAAIAAAV